jgi:site-specific recombinase XerD
MTPLAPVMQAFFTGHLAQRRASAHTVAAYRDCFRLLLTYAQARTGTAPAALQLADLDAELVGAFLDRLEEDRANSIQTRNHRLIAIHSLFTYAAVRCPEHADQIRHVLAIPPKRANRTLVSFLTAVETDALLAAPDRTTMLGRRDHALMLTAIQTGLRVSELTALRRPHLTFGTGANVYAIGKGRRERHTPLTPATARLLRKWLDDRHAERDDPVFATHHGGGPLSTDAVADLLDKHVATASAGCASLATKRVTPHTLRHTCAMNLLAAGVDLATIALYLGHANTRVIEIYLHADLALKERALAKTAPTPVAARRYRPPDMLLAFLEGLWLCRASDPRSPGSRRVRVRHPA